jgi:hypothetical protein
MKYTQPYLQLKRFGGVLRISAEAPLYLVQTL